ncbi:MAG: aspartate aminotransferase family protein [Alphaproteobacteria bacterium]|nr:MAG: aspartate aminotransferase family protein [Alphaproteobacteria bacterium]
MEDIVARYKASTPTSSKMMARSAEVIAGGVSRNFGYHIPYPVVNARGFGAHLEDVDGNVYIDTAYNGLSLIHGHASPEILREIESTLGGGWAWPGSSRAQIDFAEALLKRIPGYDKVRFTNSGTEAMMLAVKIARRATRRPLVMKARAAYHGSYPDLEAGLHGTGSIEGRTIVRDFGDTEGFVEAIGQNRDKLAAVLIEPVLVTGAIVPPPEGFLEAITEAARANDVLVILDDCLMFRLAPAGSLEFFDIEADLVVLGKFIGGGVPMGAVLGPDSVMRVLSDPDQPLYHGGSFNGNLLACRAGIKSLEMLSPSSIDRMNAQAAEIKRFLQSNNTLQTYNPTITGVGSVVGISFNESEADAKDYLTTLNRNLRFHLSCLLSGVQMGAGGIVSLATAFDEATVDDLKTRLDGAIQLFSETA